MIKIILRIIGFFIVWKIFWYLMYVSSVKFDDYRYCAKMKWSMIRDLYPINPDKWTYNSMTYPTDDWYANRVKAMRNLRYNKTPILLSFIDYQKLRFFACKYGGQSENARALQNILEDAQKDIEIKKKESEKQIKMATKKIIREVCDNGKDY